MDRPPSTTWINTFRLAAALKVVGVFVAMLTARANSDTWAFERWWGAMLTGVLLLVFLLPWYKQFRSTKAIHWQMMGVLIFAIVGHQLDLLQSSYAPYALLSANERFQLLIGWDEVDINNVHSLGALFVMVPVVLAGWQYGAWGMWLSMGLAGLLYIVAPVWLPAEAFDWWFYAVRGFVMLGVTLILAAIVTSLAAAQRRRQVELAQANARLSEQAQVREQLATSRERNRLARELHDTLAHSLSGTAVQLEAVQILLAHDEAAAKEELKRARQQIRHGLQEARRAITALRASSLEELGLVEAVRQRSAETVTLAGLRLVEKIETLPPFAPEAEQAVYRIVIEAVNNSVRHAGGTAVWLTSEVGETAVCLTVRDDGQGFVLDEVDEAHHFGLTGMRERAALIGATLEIESEVGSGTAVTLKIPRRTHD